MIPTLASYLHVHRVTAVRPIQPELATRKTGIDGRIAVLEEPTMILSPFIWSHKVSNLRRDAKRTTLQQSLTGHITSLDELINITI
jgi:hypothetical protein